MGTKDSFRESLHLKELAIELFSIWALATGRVCMEMLPDIELLLEMKSTLLSLLVQKSGRMDCTT